MHRCDNPLPFHTFTRLCHSCSRGPTTATPASVPISLGSRPLFLAISLISMLSFGNSSGLHNTNHPSDKVPILLMTLCLGDAFAPIHMGIGRCIGSGLIPAFEILCQSPINSTLSLLHSSFSSFICSSHFFPRVL